MASKEEKELWLTLVRDALNKYEIPDGKLENEELVDDMLDVTTSFADGVLDELDARYGGARKESRRRKRRKDEEDDDEDEDE